MPNSIKFLEEYNSENAIKFIEHLQNNGYVITKETELFIKLSHKKTQVNLTISKIKNETNATLSKKNNRSS